MTAGEFAPRLLAWFDRIDRRRLPWQQDISPYRVWVSEIMLQQTQVGTVIPYFEKFMVRFPCVEWLANATEDEVLHYWTGLGYYARARNLHHAAKSVVNDLQGEFPNTVEGLCELPGIGRSTAGAIVCIAGNGRAPILDGNVKRVLARAFGIDGWPGQAPVARKLWQLAEELTPQQRVADYTQAVMDLGATVCTRSSPNCIDCPFNTDCIANNTGRIADLPGRKPRKPMPVKATCMLVIENPQHEFLLTKRPSAGLWGGLWSFPECEIGTVDISLDQILGAAASTSPSPLKVLRHTFTHFHLDITPLHLQLAVEPSVIAEADNHCWFSPEAPQPIGLTRPVTKLIEILSQ